jgi:haloacid dehalogenase superfamily, subfamily IA, variant 3 with third motif having DD or ED/haloacid dehalogenase superfamily, subfamily IA, variant 1 with third motif having Dx(3-4)D or Dx(3-4)E
MIKNVIFDYGNVLIDWNPAYLFLPVFGGDKEKCRFFTDNVCNREWFTRMDRGESMDVCVAELQTRYPQYADAVAMFRDRWFEMCHGELPGMFELIQDLKSKGVGVYGLTNWPAETFTEARRRFRTLASIDNYVVSSSVKLAKPEPAIYQLLLSKYNLNPEECVFIDDRKDNVDAAKALGMSGIVYPGSAKDLASILYPLLGARNF